MEGGGIPFGAAERLLDAAGRDSEVVQLAGGVEFVVAGYKALD